MCACGTAAAALLCAAAVSAPVAVAPATVTKLRRTHPENAINVTVVALRPYNISTLNDKDSADAAGDVFFYVGDTLPQKYACKRTTHAMGCGDNSILVHDQVYTVSMLVNSRATQAMHATSTRCATLW
jgi:ribonuclease BN (tRNA processing enzyme)